MRTIKKYSNRRLYDTQDSSYINLEALAGLIRSGEVVEVVDAKTGEDLTHTVLLQVILETEGLRELFPSGFLHRIVRYSEAGGPQRAVLQQMGVGMQMLDAQMARFEGQFSWMAGMGTQGGSPRAAASAEEPAPQESSSGAEAEPDEARPQREEPPAARAEVEAEDASGDPELDALRARLAALESRLGGD